MSGSIPSSPNSVTVDRTGPSWLVASSGYEILGSISQAVLPVAGSEPASAGRAEIQVGIARSARSLEQMVVLKRFHHCPADADWVQLVAELEFAALLQQENVVRTVGIGLEAGRYFAIQEYLEGATLEALLQSCASTQTQLPHGAVVRILLAILEAVKYADLIAGTGQHQALPRAFLAVDDVFITCDGQVKLLGFKSTHARPCPTQAPAIDALLQQQLTRELRRALPRLARAANDGVGDPTEEIRRVLCPESVAATREEGRAELTLAMRQVLRKERAQQALRLAKEFARLRGPVRRPPPHASEEEAAPASGYRRIGPRESSVTAPFGLVRPRAR
jgi:hypothetical protein